MKKILCLLMVGILVLTTTFTVMANVGDVVGHAKYTDIAAFVNHYPITSYNVDGNTVVVAEDLANYGFNVVWNGDNRSLNISRSDAKEVTPYGKIYKYESMLGQIYNTCLETDIKTYINGTEIKGYNLGGKTVINFEELSVFGEVIWDASTRSIKLWLSELPIARYKPLDDINAPKKPDITDAEIKQLISHMSNGTKRIPNDMSFFYNIGRKYVSDATINAHITSMELQLASAKASFENAYELATKYDNTDIVEEDLYEIIEIIDKMKPSEFMVGSDVDLMKIKEYLENSREIASMLLKIYKELAKLVK